jgi:hypothetical protein
MRESHGMVATISAAVLRRGRRRPLFISIGNCALLASRASAPAAPPARLAVVPAGRYIANIE